MPFVTLSRNPNAVSDDLVRMLCHSLTIIVAEALTVVGDKECELTPRDVEVDIVDYHRLKASEYDFGVSILMHSHPERMANIEERARRICIRIALEIGGHVYGDVQKLKWYMNIVPVPGCFKEVSPTS